MSLRDAVLELRAAARTLEGRLKDLVQPRRNGCLVIDHSLVERVDVAALDALGWVRQVRAAVRRAVRPGAGPAEVKAALADAQRGLDRLRRGEPRQLRGRGLTADLDEFGRLNRNARDPLLKAVLVWTPGLKPQLTAARAAFRGCDAGMAACWRQLAGEPAGRVTVKTVTVVE